MSQIEGRAFAGSVSSGDLAAWLEEFDFPQNQACFYAQHALKQGGVHIAASPPGDFAPGDWEQGRIFNRDFELRWQVQDNTVALLLLGEESKPPAACMQLCDWRLLNEGYGVAPTRHMLIGALYQRSGDEWFFAEAGIPRKFRYPVDIGSWDKPKRARAVLQGKHYLDGGRLVLTRFGHFRLVQGDERR